MSEATNPADELYEHRADDDEWEEEAADVVVKPRRTQVVSFRLPTEELDELEAAAVEVGESLSQFIRQAVTLRLHGLNAVGVVPTWDLMAGKGTVVLQSLLEHFRAPRSEGNPPTSLDIWWPDHPPASANVVPDPEDAVGA